MSFEKKKNIGKVVDVSEEEGHWYATVELNENGKRYAEYYFGKREMKAP